MILLDNTLSTAYFICFWPIYFFICSKFSKQNVYHMFFKHASVVFKIMWCSPHIFFVKHFLDRKKRHNPVVSHWKRYVYVCAERNLASTIMKQLYKAQRASTKGETTSTLYRATMVLQGSSHTEWLFVF